MKLILSFLTLLAFFAAHPVSARNKPCVDAKKSCLKAENLDFLALQYLMRQNMPAHGIRMVLINDEVAFLKLSFAQMQYRNLCQQLGIPFHRNILDNSSYI